ncbi:hypothetical protein FOS14_08895 [Skermania sp. ID1734]|uniref:Clp protease N-terminal domain-containing protein n=1 Tax=Skermania sp. ID1734 TaxID=2597516 RepID=UPI00117BF7D3|nr:Clp protease N-terminal domain-containing protein [Skermania sp. ID1734]TSD99941.1 hypothetical protein FOS14_08895 [Skermania sp. ID1734]
MFERFTNAARRTVVLAQEEARVLQDDAIGSEHFLLALLHDDTDCAEVLESFGLRLEPLRREVETSHPRGDHRVQAGHIPFTPQAKAILEASLRESLHLGHDYIGNGHLLLGLIRQVDELPEPVGGAASLLREHDVAMSKLRQAITARLPAHDPRIPSPGIGHVIRLALDDEEYEQCRSAAIAAGKPLLDWARERLLATPRSGDTGQNVTEDR